MNFTQSQIDEFSVIDLEDLINKANRSYYNNTNELVISDILYDKLIENLKKKDSKNILITQIGEPISNKVKLPYHMGSMDKIKYSDTKLLQRWKKKYNSSNVTLMEKLDGVSIMLINRDKKQIAYTRGDGTYGKDISHLLTHFDLSFKKDIDFVIRGELLMSKENFSKYEALNARNLVSGMINSKKPNLNMLKDIDLVIYEVIVPEKLTILEQFNFLNKHNFKIVKYQKNIKNSELNENFLKEQLLNFKSQSEYEIDGIIIHIQESYTKNISKNPEYSFAFKSNDIENSAIVTIKNIEWNLSKDNLLKPIVIFDSVLLDGANISRASGKNGKFIYDNKIGINTKLRVIRSGAVIPDIIDIIEPTQFHIPYDDNQWKWNGVEIQLINDNDENIKSQINFKQFEHLIVSLNIPDINAKIAKLFWDNNIKNFKDLQDLTIDKLLKMDKIKLKSAEKFYNNIQNTLKNITIIDLMIATNLFGKGFSSKKFELILQEYSELEDNIYNLDFEVSKERLLQINGIAEKSANNFVIGYKKFQDYLQKNNIKFTKKEPIEIKIIGDKFKDKYVVFTGFRNKDLENEIISEGGIIQNNITKNTTTLYVKKGKEQSKKVKDAQNNNIEILII